MARRRYKRAASALTQLSKSKQDAKFNELAAQGIRAGTEAKVERMNKAFDLAGQALVTADALAQEYKTKGKIEKGVTSLAEAKGGDVSYKKTGIADIFRGEAKLSDWGKESWDIGGTSYDRADVLAFGQKSQKDLKWEGIIGKEITKYDEKAGGIVKGRTKPTTRESKEYKIQGEAELFGIEGMEKKHGKGWSYSKQKAISKMSDSQRAGLSSDKTSLLESQVAANVESRAYSTISKAYKTEYSGQEGYDASRMKALDIKHESWKKKGGQGRPGTGGASAILEAGAKKDLGDVKGIISSAKSMQQAKIGKTFTDADYGGTDPSLDKMKSMLTSGTAEMTSAAGKATAALNKVPAGNMKTPSKGYWGERKGIDVWEKYKERKAEARTKDEITSLTSGDDYVSPSELGENERIDARKASSEEILASIDNIDFNAPSQDKDWEFTDESGQNLSEYENTRPTGYGSGYHKANPHYKPRDKFSGTADQNIQLINRAVRDKFKGSSLANTWDFNKAQAGEYDTQGMILGDRKESGENMGRYTTYSDTGEVMQGLYGGKNYYPPVNLKGQGLKEMWDTLGAGDWEDRTSMWDRYMAEDN